MTYGKLANFHVIETENLIFVAHTELEDRNELANEVKGAKNEASSSKAVCATGYRVSQLVT